MPCPLLIVSQSEYLIQIVDINPHTEWETVQTQISWLLQKPTDLDLHYLQWQGIIRFSRTRGNSPQKHLCVLTRSTTFNPKVLKLFLFLHENACCGYLFISTHNIHFCGEINKKKYDLILFLIKSYVSYVGLFLHLQAIPMIIFAVWSVQKMVNLCT